MTEEQKQEEVKKPETQTQWWMGGVSQIQLMLNGAPWTLQVPSNSTYGDVVTYSSALAKVIEDAQARVNEQIEEQKKAQKAEEAASKEKEEPNEKAKEEQKKEES